MTMGFIDATDSPPRHTNEIKLYGPDAFVGMRKAGQLAAACLDMLAPHVVPGVTTGKLDDLARQFVLAGGGVPACLFYKGYRHTVCTSINHVVCHGIPGSKQLKEGESSDALEDFTNRAHHMVTIEKIEPGLVAMLTRRELVAARSDFASERAGRTVLQSFSLDALKKGWGYRRTDAEPDQNKTAKAAGAGAQGATDKPDPAKPK